MRTPQRSSEQQKHARRVERAVRAMCAIERPTQTVETVTILERVTDPQYVPWCRGVVRFTDGDRSGFHCTGVIETGAIELTRHSPDDDPHPPDCACPDCFGGPEPDDNDPAPLAEDYPGQRITGPDFDTRDREGDDEPSGYKPEAAVLYDGTPESGSVRRAKPEPRVCAHCRRSKGTFAFAIEVDGRMTSRYLHPRCVRLYRARVAKGGAR